MTDQQERQEMSAGTPDAAGIISVAEVATRSDDIAVALQELSSLLVSDETVDATLQRVADLAKRTIPGCDSAGVTLRRGTAYLTAAWTDGRTLAVDEGQYERDHGPCLLAMREKTTIRVDIATAADEWPDFTRDAVENGICSFLAAPLVVHGEGIGALNLYSASRDGFNHLDDALIALFAAQASVALANARIYADAVALADQLREAIDARAVIEQAKGVLMAREGIHEQEAFVRLKEVSQRRNVKLREVALTVVASTRPEGDRVEMSPRNPG